MVALLAKVALGIFLISGVYIWVSQHREFFIPPDVEMHPAAVAEAMGTDTSFSKEGVLMQYRSSDIPIYYLLYRNESGQFLRKELRFTDARGCSAQSGDLPCVLRYDPNYPPLQVGSRVRVTGALDAQRIKVDSITDNAADDRIYELRTVPVGASITSKGITVSATDVSPSDGCKLFVGCYADDIPQAALTITSARTNRTTTLVPGMLEIIPDGVVALVWADPTNETATVLIARRSE